MFVLSDGRRFRCTGSGEAAPTAQSLERDAGCAAATPVKIPAASRALFAALGRARACLTRKGLGVTGGPVFPRDPRIPDGPDGELIVGDSRGGAFVAFYRNAARAQRLEPAVEANAQRLGGQTERRGTVTVVWIHPPPAGDLRRSVQACTPG